MPEGRVANLGPRSQVESRQVETGQNPSHRLATSVKNHRALMRRMITLSRPELKALRLAQPQQIEMLQRHRALKAPPLVQPQRTVTYPERQALRALPLEP